MWLLVGGYLGWSPQGRGAPIPALRLEESRCLLSRGQTPAATGEWRRHFWSPPCMPGTVSSLMCSPLMPTVTLRGRWSSLSAP